MSKPTTLLPWAASGPITAATTGKIAAGFKPAERPAPQILNWLFNTFGLWIAYLNAGAFSGASSFDSTLAITGNTTVGGTLHVTGLATFTNGLISGGPIETTGTGTDDVGQTSNRFGAFWGQNVDINMPVYPFAASPFSTVVPKMLALTGMGLSTEYVTAFGHHQALGLRVFDDFATTALDTTMWLTVGATVTVANGSTGKHNCVKLVTTATASGPGTNVAAIYTNPNATFDLSAVDVGFRCRIGGPASGTADINYMGFATQSGGTLTAGLVLFNDFTGSNWLFGIGTLTTGAFAQQINTGVPVTGLTSNFQYMTFWLTGGGTQLHWILEGTTNDPEAGTYGTATVTAPASAQYSALIGCAEIGGGGGGGDTIFFDNVDAWAGSRPTV